ncbi:uncharacterized protein CTRU02_208326 [Colletotrichum truncatum]|uniref:Uncharacterized protein n=1 Tax=Colletotrichum truncatum TaxID=5467 RepID=A0ACC3YXD2_COLTU|nr:uncharacterized protein CTRU02_07493 [Colletotrichum truncatum]KAF6791153.1 hypothetical protein CTRU02_07493 [Colletotrichum truncatum]
MANQEIDYIFHHVFLPPQLPQSDDFSVHYETALVSCVLDCLVKFKNNVSKEESAAVQSAIGLIQAFIRVHIDLAGTTAVSEFELCEVLRDLDCVGRLRMLSYDLGASTYSCTGGVVPLHIRAQNAGVLITKTISDMHIETFELSPENKAVVSTIGRLRRCFPGSAIAIDLQTTCQEGFIENLAATLAQMSSQSAPDTQPLVKKAGQLHQEIRDTTHPKIVTELLNAYLLVLGRPLPGTRLWKNTREEVLWSDCHLPWRRSPTWLLIRVALQLVFGRRCVELGLSEDLYKIFMLFLVAEILNQSLGNEIPSETLILMNAKVSRRLHKLEDDREGLWLSHVRQTMCRANEILAARWSAIQQRDAPPLNLDRLRTLDFEKDTIMHLPELDQFLAQLCHRQKTTEPSDFTPSWALAKTRPETLPDLSFTHDREHLTFNLESFEVWVEYHLENWLKRRMDQKDTDACAELRQLIEGYHVVASDFYLENPEETSIMLLTILELWIACDKMAVVLYPMLLEYDPGIPNDIFENFLLPLRQQMARLHRAELYVHCRSKQSRFPAPNIYTDFGSQNSFSVRYFNQSAKHQSLLNGIQAEAQRDRGAKHAEFERLQAKYQSIMREYNQLSCTYETYYSHKLYQNVTRHSGSCKKHRCLKDAKNVVIQIHEWPLPTRQLEAKSVVFELSLPSSFGYWREATVFALFSVFRVKQHGGHNPRNRYTLGNYRGLSEYFSRNITSQHVYLLSQDKPHTVTHRCSLAVGTATTFQVCLDNALHYEYFNEYRSSMLTSFDPTQEIPRRCTYKMPEQSSSLDRFLFRPASEPNGPTPNTVIATQSNCPDQMALDEYKALCSIPLGFRLQWSNILVQLFSPSVDFRKSETRLATLQCIYQAGPSCGDILREAHKTFEDVTFCEKLLEGLNEATLRFEQNWQSSIALCTFISIAIRLLSLTTCFSIRSKCFEYLEKARRITFAWACSLKDKAQNSSGETERLLMQKREMEFALICSETFNVDDAFRSNVLSNSSNISIFIQCAIMIQESCHSHLKTLGTPLQHLYSRWQRNCLHSYQVLLEKIIIQKTSALDDALSKSWSEYKRSDQWHILSHRHGCWLTTSTGVPGETLPVHYCLVTGELLVNGMPLDHLPSQYLQHPIYAALFGRLSLEIMPTSVAGLKFSSRRLHAGHSIHLGMEKDPREPSLDLLVQARNKDSKLELIPHKYIQGKFPIDFVENYIHWYNYNDSYIEFCDISTPWTHSATNWQLRHFNDTNVWKLVRGEISLVNIKSPSARLLGSLLEPLEDSSWIHISHHSRESSLQLDLPRRRLDFSLKSGETLVRSRQFRGMSIDENQAIGTLVGLRDKLILKHDKPRHSLLSLARKVLVPEGTVSNRKAADHVDVTISKDESSRVLAYEVDHELGRIISSSRQSKLFIAYLHALTSFGLPDPLTRQSGTESSLSILTSASIMSIDWLTTENVDILRRLALLTPGRTYYPSHERVMQTVTWSRTLGCLAQHNLFLEYVVSVFKIAERSKLFHPEVYVEPPRLDHVVPELLKRDSIRSSTFRVSRFGAECHEVDYDIIYKSRDTSESSQKTRAFQIGRYFYLGLISLFQPPPVNLENHLWTFLASCPKVLGHDRVFESEGVMYSSDLILGSLDYIKKNWILLHRNLHAVNRFRTMIWIVTLSFVEISDIHILQMLARFHTDTTLQKVSAPSADSFNLSKGTEYVNERVRSAIEPGFTSYGLSTERFLAHFNFNDDSESLQKLRNLDYYSERTACQNHVVSCLRKQWPSRTPHKPAISGSKDIHEEDSTAMTAWPNYIDWNVVKGSIKNLFESWFDNGQFKEYLGQLARQSPTHDVPIVMPSPQLKTKAWTLKRKPGFLGYDEVFGEISIFLPKPETGS